MTTSMMLLGMPSGLYTTRYTSGQDEAQESEYIDWANLLRPPWLSNHQVQPLFGLLRRVDGVVRYLRSRGQRHRPGSFGSPATCDPADNFDELGVRACPVQGIQSWADSFLERLTGSKTLKGGLVNNRLPFLCL